MMKTAYENKAFDFKDGVRYVSNDKIGLSVLEDVVSDIFDSYFADKFFDTPVQRRNIVSEDNIAKK